MSATKLQAAFDPKDVEWRIGRSGVKKDGGCWAMALAYLTNRAIMNRLDEVYGPEGWKNEFREWNVGGRPGVLCGISIRFNRDDKECGGYSEWITKWDGAENTDFEAVKGGLSDSMKRAAVQWGIGRYLYNLEETFVETSSEKRQGWHYASTKEPKVVFYWKTPELPAWAIPVAKTEAYKKVSVEEANALSALIKMYGFDEPRFLSWASKAAKFNVDLVAHLPKNLYEKARTLLESEGQKA